MRRTLWKKVALALATTVGTTTLAAATAPPSSAVFYVDNDSDGLMDPLTEVSFDCELTRYGWTMFGRSAFGEDDEITIERSTPMIRFTAMGNVSAEDRCRLVTAKFNEVNRLETRYYLKTDTVFTVDASGDSQPVVSEEQVICAVMSYGVPCAGDGSFILLTLNPYVSEERILGNILDHIDYLYNPESFVLPLQRPPLLTN
jgi:hypothetical protein